MTAQRMDLAKMARAAAAAEDLVVDELVNAGPLANVVLAARISGISRATLNRRLAAKRAEASSSSS